MINIWNIGYVPVCLALASISSLGLLVTIGLWISDIKAGNWLNEGNPNPKLLQSDSIQFISEKLPLLTESGNNHNSNPFA